MSLSVLPLAAFSSLWAGGSRPGLRPSPDGPCQARVELRSEGGWLYIQSRCLNLSGREQRVAYELRTEKVTRKGPCRQAQVGRVLLLAHREVVLTRASFLLQPQQEYQLWLRILNEQGQVLAEDTACFETPPAQ